MGVVTTERVKPRRLPGVEGIWVFIGADSVIFAILFLTFMQDRLKNPALFEASRHELVSRIRVSMPPEHNVLSGVSASSETL